MLGCYLVLSNYALSQGERQSLLSKIAGGTVHAPAADLQPFFGSHHVGLLSRGQASRSSGVSKEDSLGRRVVLVGSAWRPDRPDRFCTPDEALDWITGNGWGNGPALRGHYVLLYVESNSNLLIAENDQFGLLPFYYFPTDDGLVVGSQLKLFRGWSNRSVDQQAIVEIARFGYVATDRTLLTNVRRLPPNHRLTHRSEHLALKALPLVEFTRDQPANDAAILAMDDHLQMYMARLKADVPQVSISLSGGLDSRMIAAAAKRAGLDLVAFSAGVPNSLECRVAAQFARSIDIPSVVHQSDGSKMADWFASATWLTEGRCPPGHMHFLDAMMTRNYVDRPQLHGLLGDVVAGGDYDLVPQSASPMAIEDACRKSIASFVYWPAGAFESIWNADIQRESEVLQNRILDHIFHRIGFGGTYSDYLWFKFNFRGFGFIIPCLSSQVLPWTDMYAPFLDPEIFRLSATIRSEDIADRRSQIRWARLCYPETAIIPRVKDGVLLPLDGRAIYSDEIAKLHRKQRFKYFVCRLSRGRINLAFQESYPNYDQWYRKWPAVRSYVDEMLIGAAAADHDLWNRDGVRRLLKELRLGRDVWSAVGSILQIQVLLQQLTRDQAIPGQPFTCTPEVRPRMAGRSLAQPK